MYWFYVLPLGFLLTQYTITGYDASAHLSEETRGAGRAAPQAASGGRSFCSAVVGWVVLLAITFAATPELLHHHQGGGGAVPVIESALKQRHARSSVLFISTVGQLFCGMGCVAAHRG